MKNEFYFQLTVTKEQIDFANSLVEYSMKNHKVSNIWDSYIDKKEKTIQLRFTGTLGEIIFADTYRLERPFRSFGAYDGQDLGKDFKIKIQDKEQIFDIKSMQRKTGIFYSHYVLNIPASQLHKPNSLTNLYFCISFHYEEKSLIASFLGYVNKTEIEANQLGIRYKSGTLRTRLDGTSFPFNEDTYEIDFKDITSPMLNENIQKMEGFKMGKLKVKIQM
jgi:hypothetical protein